MVPGSTLMYGSSFWWVIRNPRALKSRPIEAAVMPFPSPEATPPVTNTYVGRSVTTGLDDSRCCRRPRRVSPSRSGRGRDVLGIGRRQPAEFVEPPQRRDRPDQPGEADGIGHDVER